MEHNPTYKKIIQQNDTWMIDSLTTHSNVSSYNFAIAKISQVPAAALINDSNARLCVINYASIT